VWLTRGERGGDGAAWMMRGIECRGLGLDGADSEEGDSTYWAGRGARGSVGAGSRTVIMREERCEERCEGTRETGREDVCATIMRSEPCWETGRTMMRRGAEGVSSSSCSTFTVGGGS